MEKEITRRILRAVRQIEIRTNRIVTEKLAGSYHSAFKGQGIDFEEVREYEPGDDVRSIDWNVTAKMDRPFIKKFREERELNLFLMVDISGSGYFGSCEQSKRELAAEIASILAFSAKYNNDKVGLLLFSDKIEQFIYPQKGRQHILRLIREILFFQPQSQGTDIQQALYYVNQILKRKSVIFLLSDFLQTQPINRLQVDRDRHSYDDEYSEKMFKFFAILRRRHDVITGILSDPREFELPDIGNIILEDAETGLMVELNTSSKKVRDLYQRENEKRYAKLKKRLRQTGVDILEIKTHKPYLKELRTFFENRVRKH